MSSNRRRALCLSSRNSGYKKWNRKVNGPISFAPCAMFKFKAAYVRFYDFNKANGGKIIEREKRKKTTGWTVRSFVRSFVRFNSGKAECEGNGRNVMKRERGEEVE